MIMATKLTITYTPSEYPIVYKDGSVFDGITIPAIFEGHNAYIDSEAYEPTNYDTNNYGLGIDWDDTFAGFKAQSAHPGIIAAMKGAYEDAIAKSEAAETATAGTFELDVTGVAGPTVAYYKAAIESCKGYTVAEATEEGGEG
jgi:hypothetical protein